MTKINKLYSIIYNLLIRTETFTRYKVFSFLWKRAWGKSCNYFNGTVKTRVHSFPVYLNFGHSYPLYSRKFPHLNNPLIELIFHAYSTKHQAVNFLDIGANIGDSVLMLEKNCEGMLNQICCVEGNAQFFDYLRLNLAFIENGQFLSAFLAAENGTERELVRNKGTASSQGETRVVAVTFDRLLKGLPINEFDVVKIDTDGFDGQVLSGARAFLRTQKPAVIFEWHPILCSKTGNNWLDHFEVLEESGYSTFIWFSKFGDFSHVSYGYDEKSVNTLAEICLRNKMNYDWHYDVIALHEKSLLSPVQLAELDYAKKRRSQF